MDLLSRTRTASLSLVLQLRCILTSKLHSILHKTPRLSSSHRRRFSGQTAQDRSFTVSYLINSCGLSPESALRASKKVHFKNPEKPDRVLSFLKLHGFSKTQISKAITKLPSLILSNTEKTLSPKFKFFMSKGLSGSELAQLMSSSPFILNISLEKTIIPNFECVKNLLHTDKRTIRALKQHFYLIKHDFNAVVAPNLCILRDYGVTESCIALFLLQNPKFLVSESGKIKGLLDEVKGMGFDPKKTTFVVALSAKGKLRESTWERKVEAYEKWGLSEDIVMKAFRKHPWCLLASEKKIWKVMDFFVNKMGFDSKLIARNPLLVSCSLEKTLVPRTSVFKHLSSSGLVKEDEAILLRMLKCPQRKFLDEFVNCYDEAPQLLEIYNEKLKSSP